VCTQAEPALVVLGLPSSPAKLDSALRGDLAVLFQDAGHTPVLFAVDPRKAER
jgi:hypothetical protein